MNTLIFDNTFIKHYIDIVFSGYRFAERMSPLQPWGGVSTTTVLKLYNPLGARGQSRARRSKPDDVPKETNRKSFRTFLSGVPVQTERGRSDARL